MPTWEGVGWGISTAAVSPSPSRRASRPLPPPPRAWPGPPGGGGQETAGQGGQRGELVPRGGGRGRGCGEGPPEVPALAHPPAHWLRRPVARSSSRLPLPRTRGLLASPPALGLSSRPDLCPALSLGSCPLSAFPPLCTELEEASCPPDIPIPLYDSQSSDLAWRQRYAQIKYPHPGALTIWVGT